MSAIPISQSLWVPPRLRKRNTWADRLARFRKSPLGFMQGMLVNGSGGIYVRPSGGIAVDNGSGNSCCCGIPCSCWGTAKQCIVTFSGTVLFEGCGSDSAIWAIGSTFDGTYTLGDSSACSWYTSVYLGTHTTKGQLTGNPDCCSGSGDTVVTFNLDIYVTYDSFYKRVNLSALAIPNIGGASFTAFSNYASFSCPTQTSATTTNNLYYSGTPCDSPGGASTPIGGSATVTFS